MTDPTDQQPYQRVVNGLLRKIATGHYAIESKIPSTPELIEEYKVSQTPVRQVIRDLQRQGVLEGRQGSGVFVKRIPTDSEVNEHRDIRERLTEVETVAQDLGTRLDSGEATLEEVREQLGALQGQIMELYNKVGTPYPHRKKSTDGLPRKAGGRTARSA